MADQVIQEDRFTRVVYDGKTVRIEAKPTPSWRRALGMLWQPFCDHSHSIWRPGAGGICCTCRAKMYRPELEAALGRKQGTT